MHKFINGVRVSRPVNKNCALRLSQEKWNLTDRSIDRSIPKIRRTSSFSRSLPNLWQTVRRIPLDSPIINRESKIYRVFLPFFFIPTNRTRTVQNIKLSILSRSFHFYGLVWKQIILDNLQRAITLSNSSSRIKRIHARYPYFTTLNDILSSKRRRRNRNLKKRIYLWSTSDESRKKGKKRRLRSISIGRIRGFLKKKNREKEDGGGSSYA